MPTELRQKLQIHDGNFYLGEISTNPKIGDLQIAFDVVQPTSISVIAKQAGLNVIPYMTQAGDSLELFEYGTVSASDMFKHGMSSNTMLTWSIRFGGFIVMFIGLTLIFSVLRTLTAVLPFLADMVGFLGTFASGILAASFSLTTIAIAWIFYRPILGISLLAIAAILIFLLRFTRQDEEENF